MICFLGRSKELIHPFKGNTHPQITNVLVKDRKCYRNASRKYLSNTKGGMIVNEKIRTSFKTDVTFAVDFEGQIA